MATEAAVAAVVAEVAAEAEAEAEAEAKAVDAVDAVVACAAGLSDGWGVVSCPLLRELVRK